VGPSRYVIVDTGGISQAVDGVEALMERQVQLAIDEADHLLFLVDARDGCTPGDIEIAARLRRMGKPVSLVVNKSDTMDPVLATADFHRLGLGEPRAVSATHGRGVQDLIDAVFAGFPPTDDEGIGAARPRKASGSRSSGARTRANRHSSTASSATTGWSPSTARARRATASSSPSSNRVATTP
jgi:predicted GTPase